VSKFISEQYLSLLEDSGEMELRLLVLLLQAWRGDEQGRVLPHGFRSAALVDGSSLVIDQTHGPAAF
jgi:hypothetical protein